MHVRLITPSAPHDRSGNTATAQRWARRLRELGARVRVASAYSGEPCDLLVALHARKSAAAVERYRRLHPERPLVVALTGTDLYRDLQRSRRARRALESATRLVLLQPLGVRELPANQRRKAVVILQSAVAPRRPQRRTAAFDVAVVAHLRHEKDPLRAALAARRLPPESRVRVRHVGGGLTPALVERAAREMRLNTRYAWLGEVSPARARRLLAHSRVLVLSSRLEGGANVVSEAIVSGVPILASRIPGSVGLLGRSYPGYFEVGDTAALTALLRRAESDARFERRLRSHVRGLAPRFTPARERDAWRRLLQDLGSRA